MADLSDLAVVAGRQGCGAGRIALRESAGSRDEVPAAEGINAYASQLSRLKMLCW
jgi:hypothetical protein